MSGRPPLSDEAARILARLAGLRELPAPAVDDPEPRGWTTAQIEAGRLAEIDQRTRQVRGWRRPTRGGSW